jgi:asparagine synthase (glutamine-hydrolysing)
MCGIAGRITMGGGEEAEAFVARVVASQRARGPDAEAVARLAGPEPWSVVFGHSRLAIIDLSPAANQPLWDAGRRFCLTYNGEIYNYPELRDALRALGHGFTTSSDSEVVLTAFAAWREGAFARFNGMFALALYDRADQAVWLARDRFGVKPLLYHVTPTRLDFASSARVLAREAGLGPDLGYLARGVHDWMYESDDGRSQYADVRALPGGHVALVRAGGDRLTLTERRYYDLRARVSERAGQLAGAEPPVMEEQVRATLASAVAVRLRADVPVALSLSGGLDSAVVGALAREATSNAVRAFSFAHPNATNSEAEAVAAIVARADLAVRWVWPAPGELADLWNQALAAQDAPFAHASVLAQRAVFRAAHAEGLKVLLGGQGGDECFMGYRKFQWFRLRRLWTNRRIAAAVAMAGSLAPALAADLPEVRTYWHSLARYRRRRPAGALDLPVPGGDVLGFDPEAPPWERQAVDVLRASLPTLLRYEDRNSMGSSIESRLPFLDYRLVELGLALPEAMKLHRGYGKWVVRRALADHLPRKVVWARNKRGFSVNLAAWVRGGLGRFLRDQLESRPGVLQTYGRRGLRVAQAFSDSALLTRAPAIAEAATLLWLGSLEDE